MTNREAEKILSQYDVSAIKFYWTDGEEIPFSEWSDAIEKGISALKALDRIYAFIMQSEASETTDGVLEIFDELDDQELSNNSPKLDSENKERKSHNSFFKTKSIDVSKADETYNNDGDLILRKAAIDVAEKAFVRGLLATPDLRRLPSAQRCVSVSERLPGTNGVYNVTRWFTDGFESKLLTDTCYFDGV